MEWPAKNALSKGLQRDYASCPRGNLFHSRKRQGTLKIIENRRKSRRIIHIRFPARSGFLRQSEAELRRSLRPLIFRHEGKVLGHTKPEGPVHRCPPGSQTPLKDTLFLSSYCFSYTFSTIPSFFSEKKAKKINFNIKNLNVKM